MDNMIRKYEPSDTTTGANVAQGVASSCLSEHDFTFYSDLDSTAEEVLFENVNPVDAILGDGGLIEKYGGELPRTMEELTALPGVGRKTANLILGDVFKVPGSTVVDTHCIRISNRLGLVDNLKDPVKIEMELRKILPPEHSSDFCHCIVLHGRAVCDARKPNCAECCLRHLCQYFSGENK